VARNDKTDVRRRFVHKLKPQVSGFCAALPLYFWGAAIVLPALINFE
jgi:hypothetical protein